MRSGELQQCRWADVDYDARSITVRSPKTETVRPTPLTGGVLQLLQVRKTRESDSSYLMGNSPRNAVLRASRLLGVVSEETCGRRVTFDQLRRAFACAG